MARRLVLFITAAMPVFVCGCITIPSNRIGPGPGEESGLQPAPGEFSERESDDVPPMSAAAGDLDGSQAPLTVPEANGIEPARTEPNGIGSDGATWFHEKCAAMLKEAVDNSGMVNYKGLRRKRLDLRGLLDQYDNLDPREYESWPREDKMAFWINVYNLQKLKVVTDNYPIEPASRILTIYWGPSSIRHIEEKITRHKFLVMDEEFTFARIEKRFFRGEFDDPRMFFALSSACLSSPPLRNEPYCGRKLDEQLDDQTRRFLSSPLAFRIDVEKQKVYLSALFQQSSYGKEFAENFAIGRKFKELPAATRAVLNFITHYASSQDVSFLELGNYTIEYMTYDWTINDGS